MNSIVLSALFLSLVGLTLAHPDAEWMLFKEKHGKNYQDSSVDQMRRQIFEENKKMVEEFNLNEADKAGYRKGLNHMSDWTAEEKMKLKGFKPDPRLRNSIRRSMMSRKFTESILKRQTIPLPTEMDWRKIEGRVTPVKDQGPCGSCWAFSATGVLEGQQSLMGLNLTSLSEQNLVDCSKENFGCEGGNQVLALEFIKKEGGIDDEASYPYHAMDQKCNFTREHSVMSDEGAIILAPGDGQLLKLYLALYGPMAVSIEATDHFMAYHSGVFSDPTCNHKLDHAVLVVGYGTSKDGKDYWIVKNSWADTWGDKGYVYMAASNIKCGVLDEPVAVIL